MGPDEAAVLKGTATGTAVREMQQAFDAFVELVRRHKDAVAEAFPLGDIKATGAELPEGAEEPAGPFSFPEPRLRWASSIVTSKARGITTARGVVPCIVPVLHVMGHSPSARTLYSLTRRAFKVTHAGPSHQPRGSDEAATPGKEVVVNYMPRRWNADLLAFFGRVSTSEVHSALHIHSADPPGMDAARKLVFDRASALLRLLKVSNGVLISPLGLSTASLNVARVRSMEDSAFTPNGLRTLAKLNNKRHLDDSWRPDPALLRSDPEYGAAEAAWVFGIDGSPPRHRLADTDGVAAPAGEPINAQVAGLRMPINLEVRAVTGLLEALNALHAAVFSNSTAEQDAALVKGWKVRPRKRSQAPGSDAPGDPNPTAGPRLLREALRARMQEKLAVEVAIRDAEARLRATEANGAAAVGGVGWSADLVDAAVRSAPQARVPSADDLAAESVRVSAGGDTEPA